MSYGPSPILANIFFAFFFFFLFFFLFFSFFFDAAAYKFLYGSTQLQIAISRTGRILLVERCKSVHLYTGTYYSWNLPLVQYGN